jgi:hypothetical protein
MNQERMFKPALIGGVILGILSALPFVNVLNCFCCAWVIGGGMVAAYLFVQESAAVVTLGQGVLLGLLTGVIGGIVQTLFSIPLHLMLAGFGMSILQQMQQAVEQVPNLPPETRDTFRALFGRGGWGIAFWILTGFVTVVIYALVGMLGGTIGVAVFEKRKPQAPDYYPPVPPPPPPQYPQQ